MATTSLKLPEELKREAAALAAEKGVSTHAFLVDSVRKNISAEQRRKQFIAHADESWQEMQETGEKYASDDVHDYFLRRARGEKSERPKPITIK